MSSTAEQTATKSKLSEADFLRLQARDAKLEISRALDLAKVAVAQKVDPRGLTRRHPWIAIASAAVAGFTAAAIAIPSKEHQELRRLEKLHRAMNPPPAPPSPSSESNGKTQKATETRSIGSTILHEIIQLIRPILLTMISTSMKPASQPPPDPTTPAADPQGPDKSL